VVPEVRYRLLGSKAARALLWGDWSLNEDPTAWTIGDTCWLRFKVRRSDLTPIESPALQLDIEASMPTMRPVNKVDLESAGSNALQRIIFLNKGCVQNMHAFDRDPIAHRTTVVAGDKCVISLPLARNGAVLEDRKAAASDTDDFAYFRVDVTNPPNLSASLFGGDDQRHLGVSIREFRVWDSAAEVA
jgi:hypothetical protein